MLAPRARAIEGDRITAIHRLQGESTRFADAVLEPAPADVAQRLEQWRNYYRMGVRGPVEWVILPSTGPPRLPTLDRPAIWNSKADGWARRHLGMIVQMSVFTGAALILLLMRSYDLTAGLCVLALAFSARRRRRSPARRGTNPAAWRRDSDRLRVDRKPARLSDHRFGDPLLPDAIAPARSHAVAARDSSRCGAAARHSGAGHCVLSRRPGRCPWPRGMGRHASGRLLRRFRRRAGDQRARGARRRVSLPLQPQRQRAAADQDGALHRRARHPRLRPPRRHPDRRHAFQSRGAPSIQRL